MLSQPCRHDFLETAEGLIFAVLVTGLEQRRALCFLRYVRERQKLRKLNTAEANQLLASRSPQYLYHSPTRDAQLHGVPLERIITHYQPRGRAGQLASGQGTTVIAERCGRLVKLLGSELGAMSAVGVTGSLLVGAETDASDIDLVIYGADAFHQARQAIRAGVASGEFSPLDQRHWHQAYARRGSELSLDEYVWHERRKCNKAVFEGTKFDISLGTEISSPAQKATKTGRAIVTATVVDDRAGFDFPARWRIEHQEVQEVVAFTPTYIGQALAGETIEAAGFIERLDDDTQRLAVGTSREASGQWIKVVR